MCQDSMVCYGDKLRILGEAYTEDHRKKVNVDPNQACKAATFYISNDGKYAIDTSFVSEADLNDPNFNHDHLPRIPLAEM